MFLSYLRIPFVPLKIKSYSFNVLLQLLDNRRRAEEVVKSDLTYTLYNSSNSKSSGNSSMCTRDVKIKSWIMKESFRCGLKVKRVVMVRKED